MRRAGLVLVLVVLGGFLTLADRSGARTAAPPNNFRAGELVVIPGDGVAAESLARELSRTTPGIQAGRAGASGRAVLLRVPPGREREYAARLRADARVEAVAPNYLVSIAGESASGQGVNDPGFANQWNLVRIGLPDAWTSGARADGITVAVIDTGVDYGHPDLQGALLPGCTFLADYTCGADAAGDDHGHGTHVAGTIAAVPDNAIGISGIAWGARVLPLKVLGSDGNGAWFGVIDAIYYAAQQPTVRVINLSLSGVADSEDAAALAAAIDVARGRGIAVIAAAGNGSTARNLDLEAVYPAVLPGVIAVTATDRDDVRSPYANYGRAVAVAAPGSDIYSTLCVYNTAERRCGHDYGWFSGTSMAAPHAAALAALLYARYPALTPDGLKRHLQQNALDLGAPYGDPTYGCGRIDAARALATAPLVAAFPDLSACDPYVAAVGELAARGIVAGYADGRFGPADLCLRFQLATWLERALGTPAGVNATSPLARPSDAVTQIDVVSTIVRGMIAAGRWQLQPDAPGLYPNIPAASEHRREVATYVHYAGPPHDSVPDQGWTAWNQPATRGWVALALWRALSS